MSQALRVPTDPGRTHDEGGTDELKAGVGEGEGGLRGSAQSRRGVSFNWLTRTRASDLIGLTGSPGVWEIVEGKRACDLHSPPAFSNLVRTATAGSGVIPPLSQGSGGD